MPNSIDRITCTEDELIRAVLESMSGSETAGMTGTDIAREIGVSERVVRRVLGDMIKDGRVTTRKFRRRAVNGIITTLIGYVLVDHE